jgi:DNA-binding NarL/FixJ family response regulator
MVLKADRLYSETICTAVAAAVPGAEVIQVHCTEAATTRLAECAVSLLITGTTLDDDDVIDFLASVIGQRRARSILVVTSKKEQRLLTMLRTLAIGGVFDSNSEGREQLGSAIQHVIEGRTYWSSGILRSLAEMSSQPGAVCRLLTVSEQLVFSVIGDGSDDATGARRLGLRPSTVHAIRRELHRKLGVQQRGDLVRAAVQFGFVRFTRSGVVRPGFSHTGSPTRCIFTKSVLRTRP